MAGMFGCPDTFGHVVSILLGVSIQIDLIKRCI